MLGLLLGVKDERLRVQGSGFRVKGWRYQGAGVRVIGVGHGGVGEMVGRARGNQGFELGEHLKMLGHVRAEDGGHDHPTHPLKLLPLQHLQQVAVVMAQDTKRRGLG